jgi:hypothetical protein
MRHKRFVDGHGRPASERVALDAYRDAIMPLLQQAADIQTAHSLCCFEYASDIPKMISRLIALRDELEQLSREVLAVDVPAACAEAANRFNAGIAMQVVAFLAHQHGIENDLEQVMLIVPEFLERATALIAAGSSIVSNCYGR